MTSLIPEDIARLVLGYLQTEKLDKAALEFCKSSQYLSNVYRLYKLGHRAARIGNTTLISVLKEYTKIQQILDDFCDEEQDRLQQQLGLDTLVDKAKYACRRFTDKTSTTASNVIAPTAHTLKRKCNSSSDVSEPSSPEATNVQHLPGYRPKLKRRKIFDPRLLLSQTKREVTDEPNVEYFKTNTITPDKTQMPTCSKYLQPESASKLNQSVAEQLANTIMTHGFQDKIAECINNEMNADANTSLMDQIENSLPNILSSYEQCTTYDDIVREAMRNHFGDEYCEDQLSTPSRGSFADDGPNEAIELTDQTMNTPVLNESIRSRLRPRKDNSFNESGAAEAAAVPKAKDIEILSDQCLRPGSTIDPHVIIVKSDSDETVTTTTTQQAQMTPYVVRWVPTSRSLEVCTNMTDSQPLLSTANLPALIDSQPFVFPDTFYVNENRIFVTKAGATINESGVGVQMAYGNVGSAEDRFIVVDANDVENAGRVTTNAVQTQPTKSLPAPLITINIDDSPTVTISDVDKSGGQTDESTRPTESHQSAEPLTSTESQSQPPQPLTNSELFLQSLPIITESKAATPSQMIKSTVPSSARSLSTPRHKISHVRVLDFNTPSRSHLTQITETRDESFALNASRIAILTPHNQSIAVSLPSSAPPKLAFSTDDLSTQPSMAAVNEESSSSENPFSQDNDNDTVVSANSVTPKVRRGSRTRCNGRKLSPKKEAEDPVKPSKPAKRTTRSKKPAKDTSPVTEQSPEVAEKPEKKQTVEEAKAEWERNKAARGMGAQFEQLLREENSRKQVLETFSNRGNRRVKAKRKRPAARSKAKAKRTSQVKSLNSTADMSLNSTACSDVLDNTQTMLEAQLLEQNLRSATKQTPAKQSSAKKSKKRTPCGKFKIMPSPKVKGSSKTKSAKKNRSATQSSEQRPTDGARQEVEASNSSHQVDGRVAQNPANATDAQPSTSTAISVEAAEVESSNSGVTTEIDLEGAQNLLSIRDTWHKGSDQSSTLAVKTPAEIISSSSSAPMARPIELATKTTCAAIIADRLMPSASSAESIMSRAQPQLIMNMSSLLETPFKVDMDALMPKTPCINTMISQLITPSLKTADFNILDESSMKNPLFPTPSVPITPGATITPAKDSHSPRTAAHEMIYGAANRPTDYSSSSSYYKPDESDGIDKQIEASRRSSVTNCFAYSADEIDPNESQQNQSNSSHDASSSSSSSSSSDSSSDSDSDSDSSDSSDSNASQLSQPSQPSMMQHAPDNAPGMMEHAPHMTYVQPEFQQIPAQCFPLTGNAPVESVNNQVAPEEHANKSIEQLEEMVCENEIKLHLTSTSEMPIAQNILLSQPEETVVDRQAQIEQLMEKRRRVQEKLKDKSVEKFVKPKPTRRIRSIAAEKHAATRAPPSTLPAASPSKRKASQPKRILPIAADVSADSATAETSKPKQSITTKLMSDTASDIAVVDASDVAASSQPKMADGEETIDAIKKHLALQKRSSADTVKTAAQSTETIIEAKRKLIETLEQDQGGIKRPPAKAMVIEALPLNKATRSRSKKMIIAPANVVSKPEKAKQAKASTSSSSDAKASKTKPNTRRSNSGRESKSTTSIEKSAKCNLKAAESKAESASAKEIQAAEVPATNTAISAKPTVNRSESAHLNPQPIDTTDVHSAKKSAIDNEATAASSPIEITLATPAKSRQQLQDLFGDMTDLETPIKSPPRKSKFSSEAATSTAPQMPTTTVDLISAATLAPDTLASITATATVPSPRKIEVSITEADSSSANHGASSSDDGSGQGSSSGSDTDDDDSCEMVTSIDETDKQRYFSVVIRGAEKTRRKVTPATIDRSFERTRNIVLDGEKIVLSASDDIELYVREPGKEVSSTDEPPKNVSSRAERSRNVDLPVFGKPLHTSTPSPNKTIVPRFVVKHKDTTSTYSGKFVNRQAPNENKPFNVERNNIDIEEALNSLHGNEDN